MARIIIMAVLAFLVALATGFFTRGTRPVHERVVRSAPEKAIREPSSLSQFEVGQLAQNETIQDIIERDTPIAVEDGAFSEELGALRSPTVGVSDPNVGLVE